MNEGIKVIIITGTMGSGKTTVMGEASDILTEARVAHAAIDLDALGVGHVPQQGTHELRYRNLVAVWANYQAVGVTRLLIAEALESTAELDSICTAVPNADVVVCRLTVAQAIAQARVRTREPGMLQKQFLVRVEELSRLQENVKLENFSIHNDEVSVTEVAREMLRRAEWI